MQQFIEACEYNNKTWRNYLWNKGQRKWEGVNISHPCLEAKKTAASRNKVGISKPIEGNRGEVR